MPSKKQQGVTMTVPEHDWRHPTRAAIDSLAKRFSLPNDPGMQDWEYQVADRARLPEFLAALEQEAFTDDERFTLSEIVMQCFEDWAEAGHPIEQSDEWQRFATLLRSRPRLHAHTLHYWSALDSTPEDAWRVSPLVRALVARPG